ncbi:MAG: glycosyltransferase family 4 protein [Salegentibacter sp.]|uniref:glycosyltransferase family 4 protein n=1 Tax=Salegentibacter sp. TaxID=1903072 RepID=UPI00286FE37A|nr:glycosyltransferase family 4 protein [Salegentibacter sp.]MDR9456973.1 glycosyltransferase family 4 protein [Salegentibacter sp.]
MKILHVSGVKNWGGGENQIQVLCREFKNHHPEIQNLILCNQKGWLYRRLEKTDLKFLAAPLALKIDPRFILKLITVCNREKIDLIHLHDPTALSLAVMADHFKDLPPFVLSKKTSFPIKQRKQSLYKYNYPKIRKIFCVSEATRMVCIKSIKSPEKVLTLYHGIDKDLQESSKASLNIREILKIPSEKKIIGNIANHIRAKDLHTLIKTANQLINLENRSDFHFVQIGNFAKERTSLLKLTVKQYGLEENFSFLGFRENASALIPQFDISIMTSQSEGLPQFIYESFFHKVPVISTSVGGIPEIITHKSNGLLAEAHDYKKLCENILFLANNEELIPKFAEISYQKLLENFTSIIMAKNTFEEYKKILNERL